MPWLPNPRCCSWWHVPPAWQPPDDPRPYYREARHRFCVVRDPLARLFSHFVWMKMRRNDVVSDAGPLCARLQRRGRNALSPFALYVRAVARQVRAAARQLFSRG